MSGNEETNWVRRWGALVFIATILLLIQIIKLFIEYGEHAAFSGILLIFTMFYFCVSGLEYFNAKKVARRNELIDDHFEKRRNLYQDDE